MKKLIHSAIIISFALGTQNKLNAQTKEDIEYIKKANNQKESLKLQKKLLDYKKKQEVLIADFLKKNPTLSAKSIDKDGNVSELVSIENGSPIYYTTSNSGAAASTRTNFLHTGGSLGTNVNGENMTAFIWDEGHVMGTHQEFTDNNISRVSYGDVMTGRNPIFTYHSTHVGGTLVAKGHQANAKGMAPKAKIRSYNWTSDFQEAKNASLNLGALVSNHSYDYRAKKNDGTNYLLDYVAGNYDSAAEFWDYIMYNAPYYLYVKAAGNNGHQSVTNQPLEGNFGYDKLLGGSLSKNGLTVANADAATLDAKGNLVSVTIAPTSSQGPSDDLRIKPDITGHGVYVYSPVSSSNSSYINYSGTSMATPNVGGTLLLLQQYYKAQTGKFMKGATLKGLALHTADDAGSTGPDAVYGWGLLNAKRAGEMLKYNNSKSLIEERTLNQGGSYSFTVTAIPGQKLIASICWYDVYGLTINLVNNPTPKLVNDLDIRITQNGVTYFPWRLTSVTTNEKGDNFRDPFERIEIPNANGTYTITVSHKGTLSTPEYNYSLLVSGIQLAATSTLSKINLSSLHITEKAAELKWNNEATDSTYKVYYKLKNSNEWNMIKSKSPSITLSDLNANKEYDAYVTRILEDGTESTPSNTITFSTLPSIIGKSTEKKAGKENKANPIIANLYPNPSSGQIHIDLNDTTSEEIKVKVTTMEGKLVYNEKFLSKNLRKSIELNLQNLSDGTYLISLETKNEMITKKLIIKK